MADESKVRRVVCPGSFDPVTNGHLDIIERAARLYDEVVVAVFVNRNKSGLFTVDERIAMLQEATGEFPHVRIDTLFMPTNPEYSFLASSLVKDIAGWGGDVSALVPPTVLKRLIERAKGSE